MMQDLATIARRIRLLALDVDGVLTDGRIHYIGNSEEMKSFSILDGLGIKLLHCPKPPRPQPKPCCIPMCSGGMRVMAWPFCARTA